MNSWKMVSFFCLILEKINEIRRHNQILLDKLVDISKGRQYYYLALYWRRPNHSVGAPKKREHPKSLNYYSKKREAERIDLENQKIMQRIVKQGPIVAKSRLDEEFKTNSRYKKNIQRSAKVPM